MSLSQTKTKSLAGISVAFLLVGLVTGAGIAYVTFQAQLAQLAGELSTTALIRFGT
jgi:hypothetical protein